MDRKAIVVLAVGVLGASSMASAQRWGRESHPRDGVCFFENPDFRGDYFCVRTGDDLRSMPSEMNDRISSLRIYGRAEVEVYKDGNFKGKSARFDGDVRDLRLDIWNDRISSVRVRSGPGQGGSHYGGGSYGGGVIHERPAVDPDQIIRRAYRDLLDRDPDSAGLRLYRSRILDDDWSEAQVREAIRSSPEYRQKSTMTRPKAEEIVRSAYLSVLGREPDSGSRSYVDKVMRDNWTRQDVERELRKSPEYRNKR
ncbi:MAG TPA: peptidase inhibitor family I36 protein [Vicinamibacteria bacterium]|nr:peptidase inhibitor family I36 protein [Vicinamibacteria bacterium]